MEEREDDCMFYHVFARAEGHFIPPGDCDLQTEEAVLENYCIRVQQKKPITIGGAILEAAQIKGLKIYQSNEPSALIVRSAPSAVQQKRHGREYEALRTTGAAEDITSRIMRLANERIDGNIKESMPASSSITISDSTLNNSPVTGLMNHSAQTITINKSSIEGWLRQITAELEKNHVQNEELAGAIDTLTAALQAQKPSGLIIKNAVEAVKAVAYGLLTSAAWQYLMEHPPI
jgi:hypothetical protein